MILRLPTPISSGTSNEKHIWSVRHLFLRLGLCEPIIHILIPPPSTCKSCFLIPRGIKQVLQVCRSWLHWRTDRVVLCFNSFYSYARKEYLSRVSSVSYRTVGLTYHLRETADPGRRILYWHSRNKTTAHVLRCHSDSRTWTSSICYFYQLILVEFIPKVSVL